MKFKV